MSSKGEAVVLQALTEWDRAEWMAVIGNNIQWLLDHKGVDGQLLLTARTNARRSSVSVRCVDCGAEGATWCCLNWATTICMNCSGVHRAIGVQTSQVRSLTLDRIDSRLLDLFSLVGNATANLVLAEGAGETHLEATAKREERDDFIRRKYDKLEFVVPREIDLDGGIAEEIWLTIYRGVCQLRKAGDLKAAGHALRLAACHGNPSVVAIFALNFPVINSLDESGWSALSYAAYYGKITCAEILLLLGGDPNASPKAHPYAIAKTRNRPDLAGLFASKWAGGAVPDSFTPLLVIESRETMPGKSETLALISMATVSRQKVPR
jgi:hypothetical protein